MRLRSWVSLAALVGLMALPASARPDTAEKTKAPGLVIQIKSIDGLIDDGKYLAGLAGQEDKAQQVDGFLDSLRNDKGLQGIDTKRPLGIYGAFGEELTESKAVVLIPISDEKAFLDLLERFGQKAEKGKDGVYTVTSDKVPIPIYLRFAHDYAYATAPNKAALEEDSLLDPAKVLLASRTGMVYTSFRINQIPKAFQQIALQMIDQKVSEAKEKEQPGETEKQKAFREKAADGLGTDAATLVKDGELLEINLNVDRKSQQVSADVSLTGKPDSHLAADIAALGQSKSLFTGLAGPDSAMNLLIHLELPTELRQAFASMIEDGIQQALTKEKDETKRGQAEKLFQVLDPTIKSGELDAAVTFRGPGEDKHYTLVWGMKVKDGAAVEKAFRDLVSGLPDKDKERIEFDVESAGDVKIHRITIPKGSNPPAEKVVGINPLYFAVRDDAAFSSIGPDGLAALKAALASTPKAGPQFQLNMAVARLAPLLPQPNAREVAEKVFGANGDQANDQVTVTVEGGKALKVHFAMKAEVVKFLSQLQQPAGEAKPGHSYEEKPAKPPVKDDDK